MNTVWPQWDLNFKTTTTFHVTVYELKTPTLWPTWSLVWEMPINDGHLEIMVDLEKNATVPERKLWDRSSNIPTSWS